MDIASTNIQMTENGREFLETSEMDMPDLRECFINMNEKNARFLELVSTILYFDQDDQGRSDRENSNIEKQAVLYE